MDLLLFVTSLSMIWKFSQAIQCYHCEPEVSETAFDKASPRLCEHFNRSDFFGKECEKSTMCFKRVVTLDLGNGKSTVAVTRDCAPQTFEGEQKKVNRHWESVKTIYEVYDEACTENDEALDKITKTTDCYCRGGLCNGSYRVDSTVAGLMWIVLLLNCLS